MGVIEHKPWCGPEYKSGIEGQRIAIVGYSHHGLPDRENFTEEEVKREVRGGPGFDSFFRKVRSYFRFDDAAAFWNRVLFFNFLPSSVGGDDQKYSVGTKDQIDLGKKRFLRILEEHKPDKVFVFTMKGWRRLPNTIEEKAGKPSTLGPKFPPNFSWGTYAAASHLVMAFGLLHPERAPNELMRRAVEDILVRPLVDGRTR